MTRCVKHERCPQCAKLGKDKHGDNLAIYDDNSDYCFSCGYSTHANSTKVPQERGSKQPIYLPLDVDNFIPQFCCEWLQKYQLDELDYIQNKLFWSESLQRLIFPIFNTEGLLAWQGRYFGTNPKEAKWYSIGNMKIVYHILGQKQRDSLVLVEDIVSAIKIAKYGHQSMPLFGSHIGMERLLFLRKLIDKIIIWLDPDKNKEALSTARLCDSLSISSRVILSDRDPKDHSFEAIQKLLDTQTEV